MRTGVPPPFLVIASRSMNEPREFTEDELREIAEQLHERAKAIEEKIQRLERAKRVTRETLDLEFTI